MDKIFCIPETIHSHAPMSGSNAISTSEYAQFAKFCSTNLKDDQATA